MRDAFQSTLHLFISTLKQTWTDLVKSLILTEAFRAGDALPGSDVRAATGSFWEEYNNYKKAQ